MTVAARPDKRPELGAADWKSSLIVALYILTVLALCLTLVNGQHYKTEEARVLNGVDFLMGHTEGKSEGSPHPLLIGALVFCVLGVYSALFKSDKFLYSILCSLFLVACVAMFRFDVTYLSLIHI